MNKEKAIIDGANVAYLQAPQERRANISNIFAVAQAVEAIGLDPIVVIDLSNRAIVADTHKFQAQLGPWQVVSVPPGADSGRVVLETADKYGALIVSNNIYAEYYEDYPGIEQRRIPVAFIDGTVLLLNNTLKRAS